VKYFPWILAFFWLAARIAVGRFMDIESAKNFGVLSNVLLVLILIFITVYNKYKAQPAERPTFLADVKDCMKVAMKYVIGATIALGIYYGFASNDIEVIRSERIEVFSEQIATDEGLQKFYEAVPLEKGTSREDLLKKNQENVETFVSTKTQVIGGFVTLSFVSFVYTLLAVLIWRTIMKRN
jgi:hypothetical protein